MNRKPSSDPEVQRFGIPGTRTRQRPTHNGPDVTDVDGEVVNEEGSRILNKIVQRKGSWTRTLRLGIPVTTLTL